MRKTPFFLVLLVLLLAARPPRCVAQAPASTWQVGLRIIPQLTALRYDTGFPVQDYLQLAPHYTRLRAAVGFGVVYQPFRRWSVGADVLYSWQGGGFEARRTNLNYLKLPLWVGYSARPERAVCFNLQTGLDLAYLTRAVLRYPGAEAVGIGPYVRRTSWGPTLALGTRFGMGQGYSLNTQLLVHTSLGSLSRTDPDFGAHHYILPGLRLSFDRSLPARR